MNEILVSTRSLLRNRRTPLSQQIRNFLIKFGTSHVSDIRLGIAKDKESAKYLHTEVSVNCQRMAKSGVLLREKRKLGSFYSLQSERASGQKLKKKYGAHIAASRQCLNKIQRLSQHCDPEIKHDVICELFLLMHSGRYKISEMEKAFDLAIKHVRKEIRGGRREEISMDKPFRDSPRTRHDLLDGDTQIDAEGLYRIERLSETINSLESQGYRKDQVRGLYESAGSSWLTGTVFA